ncbi:MAG: hypothetical protein ACJ780_10080 [Solirubrobacteraceae bacterium]|jgi:hypothetical protein
MTHVTDIIERLRAEGRTHLDADQIAYAAVPGGPLPEDHPDYLSHRDPWSVAWDEADTALHPEVQP